jgi:hypothetical protein
MDESYSSDCVIPVTLARIPSGNRKSVASHGRKRSGRPAIYVALLTDDM